MNDCNEVRNNVLGFDAVTLQPGRTPITRDQDLMARRLEMLTGRIRQYDYPKVRQEESTFANKLYDGARGMKRKMRKQRSGSEDVPCS